MGPNRFLIPLLSMEPNNQLEGFLESVFLAIKLNRTLCIPPFYKHKTDDLNEAVSSKLRLDSSELAKQTKSNKSVRQSTQSGWARPESHAVLRYKSDTMYSPKRSASIIGTARPNAVP